MKANDYDLPHLAEIFQMLSSGRHICLSDGKYFYAIQNDLNNFTAFFKALKYDLITHPKEFYYFKAHTGNKNNNKSTQQMALFVFILIEHLDKKEADLVNQLMSQRFSIENLPHLKTERYTELMKEVGVTEQERIRSILETLQKYGFVILHDNDTFDFKTPIHRFFDLCVAELKKAELDKGEI